MATKASATKPDATASDWRAEVLDRARAIIMSADPGIAETRKWAKASNNMQGVPVWEHAGIITTGETYRDYVKLTFAHGARLEDPAGLFNAGFGGGTRRAIDLREGDKLNETALKALVKAAIAFNTAKKPAPKKAVAKKK